jgi:hypothetical protein
MMLPDGYHEGQTVTSRLLWASIKVSIYELYLSSDPFAGSVQWEAIRRRAAWTGTSIKR